ncbi:hypothetical protein SRHO_G00256520 [Serrasalmus rhombeus]
MQSCSSALCVLILLITTFTAGKPQAEEQNDIKGDIDGPSHDKPEAEKRNDIKGDIDGPSHDKPEAEKRNDIKGDNRGPSHDKPEAEKRNDIKGDNRGPSHGKREPKKQIDYKGELDGQPWEIACVIAGVVILIAVILSQICPRNSKLDMDEEKSMPLDSSEYRLIYYKMLMDEGKPVPLDSSGYMLLNNSDQEENQE